MMGLFDMMRRCLPGCAAMALLWSGVGAMAQAQVSIESLDPNPVRTRAATADFRRACQAEFEAGIAHYIAVNGTSRPQAEIEMTATFEFVRSNLHAGGEASGGRFDGVANVVLWDAATLRREIEFTLDQAQRYPGAFNKLRHCAAVVALRHAEQGVPPLGAGTAAAAAPTNQTKTAPQPPEDPDAPPQIKVVMVEQQGSACVKIEQGPTTWSDEPSRRVQTAVRLRNTCATQQLVEAQIAEPGSPFSRPQWSPLNSSRNIWRPIYPVKALGFLPVEDMYQVFVMRPGQVSEYNVNQTLGSEGDIQGRTMACDHFVGDKERTLFKTPDWGQWRCAQLPPPEIMDLPRTYTDETRTIFIQELVASCTSQHEAFVASGEPLPKVGEFTLPIYNLYVRAVLSDTLKTSIVRNEVSLESGALAVLQRCIYGARQEQIRRGTFPSWSMVR